MKNTIALLNCHGDDVYCFRKEIIDALTKNGYDVLLSCPESDRLDAFRENKKIIIEDIKIDRRGTNPINDIKLCSNYIKLFRKYKPRIVCTFTVKPNIYGSIAADIMNIPHINNITGLGSGFQNGGIVSKIVIMLYRIALHKSKMIFFQNRENQNSAIESHMITNHIPYKCLPGSGVNLKRFSYVQKKETDIVTFNYIGRVLKDKRIDDYLFAAKAIHQQYDNVAFNIIGFIEPTEAHYKKTIEDLEEKKIVHYCGSVNDVRPYIIESDAIIHPSSYGEGMSNVLLESASIGRAIITTDISGCRETVENGKTGYIYHAENVEELIECIEKYLSLSYLERANMGLEGRKRVEKYFNRDIVVNEYLGIINEEVSHAIQEKMGE